MSTASPPADARRRRSAARVDTRTGYARLLRLRHITLGFYPSLALFEGSIAFAVVLAFGEVISAWGAAAIPVAVAVMVKLNDVVAGLLARPKAEAQLRRSGSTPVVTGRSPVPRPSRLTQWIDRDDAVPYEMPVEDEAGAVARGVASVPDVRRPPAPGVPAGEAAVEPAPAEPFELIGTDPAGPDPDPPAETPPIRSADTAAEWTGDERRERIGDADDIADVGDPGDEEHTGDDQGRPGSEPPGRGNVGRFLR